MKLLLTSAGIKNTSIRNALVDLLGKPIAEASALCIPTAIYAFPGGALSAWRLISGRAASPLVELGWKSVGVLELTALPSIDTDVWVPQLQGTDALLVGGGDPMYLCHWMQRSGLADLFPSLAEIVYVGVSAGSLVMGPVLGKEFVVANPPTGVDRALGLVGFSMFPHLDHEAMPEHSMANAERWAAGLPVPGYAIDDQTAIRVVGDTIEVVSEATGSGSPLDPQARPRRDRVQGRGSAATRATGLGRAFGCGLWRTGAFTHIEPGRNRDSAGRGWRAGAGRSTQRGRRRGLQQSTRDGRGEWRRSGLSVDRSGERRARALGRDRARH